MALLRGINVGGNAKVPMPELKQALIDDGFTNVKTYINSGNVFFDSDKKESSLLKELPTLIKKEFKLDVPVVLFTQKEWKRIIEQAPAWWGEAPDWRHNLLILLEPFDIKQAIEDFGTLKPDIENMEPGSGVLYQSDAMAFRTRSTYSKIVGKSLYKKMTIRNYNTATKLLNLFDEI